MTVTVTKRSVFVAVVGAALVAALIIVSTAYAKARMEKLPRNDTYYEIVNDGDDFGNYIESYWIPTPRGKVFCLVYSDKIGDGGGAGMDCDWGNAR